MTPVWKPDLFDDVSFSRDGTHLAAAISAADGRLSDVWVIDVGRSAASQLTDNGTSDSPIWSKDGRSVIYSAFQGLGVKNICLRRSDGLGDQQLLVDTPKVQKTPIGWSSDGALLFTAAGAGSGMDLWSFDASTRHTRVVMPQNANVQFAWDASLSPDGALIAYSVTAGSTREVYVQRISGGTRVQVSTDGGERPLWRGDSRELYYIARGKVIAAGLRTSTGGVEVAGVHALFTLPAGTRRYQPRADGQRFLLIVPAGPSATQMPTAITNWRNLIASR